MAPGQIQGTVPQNEQFFKAILLQCRQYVSMSFIDRSVSRTSLAIVEYLQDVNIPW